MAGRENQPSTRESEMKQPKFVSWLGSMLENADLALAETDLSGSLVKANETVVGVLEDEALRRLYAVQHGIRTTVLQRFDAHGAEHDRGAPHDESVCRAAVSELSAMAKDADLVKDIFWRDLREAFPAAETSIGIRAGWQVVSIKEQERRSSGISIISIGDLLGL